MSAAAVIVVGIGEDGWDGLPPASAAALQAADVVLGSPRQVGLVAGKVRAVEEWPAPMSDALPGLLERYAGRRLVVLASGDPLLHGVGASLVRLFGDRVEVLPAPSSVSLACARLRWPVPEVTVLSLVTGPYEVVRRVLQPGRRLLILVAAADGAARLGRCAASWGGSPVTVLERLGGPSERCRTATLGSWAGDHDPLAIVAVQCVPDPGTVPLPLTPGLPDEAYDSDGALTKREVRAVTVAALAPLPGQLLWDIGAGSGSIGIEWMRTDPSCSAVAVERRADRCARIRANAARLGVPGLSVAATSAPGGLAGLPPPDAVFIGGGVTEPGLVEACLAALPPGGRLVANAVTLETEAALVEWRGKAGGTLTRLEVARAGAVGSFTAYRPALPVTQWVCVR